MRKKVLSLIMAVVMLLSMSTAAFAIDDSNNVTVVTKAQQPRWTYIISCSTGLSISGNYAEMSGIIDCTSSINSVKITLTLQRYENGAWASIYSDSTTCSGSSGDFVTGTTVSSGTYRTAASYQAKIGSRTVESTSNTSPQKTC